MVNPGNEVLMAIHLYSTQRGWEWLIVRDIPGEPDGWLEVARARTIDLAWEQARLGMQRRSDLMDLGEDVA